MVAKAKRKRTNPANTVGTVPSLPAHVNLMLMQQKQYNTQYCLFTIFKIYKLAYFLDVLLSSIELQKISIM